MIYMNKLFLSRTATKTVIISRSIIEFGRKIILATSVSRCSSENNWTELLHVHRL